MKVEQEQEQGIEHFDIDTLAKECYLQSATSMPGLLMSKGMPPEFLDELAEGMREAKRKETENNIRGE
jgi:hypothetical protein